MLATLPFAFCDVGPFVSFLWRMNAESPARARLGVSAIEFPVDPKLIRMQRILSGSSLFKRMQDMQALFGEAKSSRRQEAQLALAWAKFAERREL